MISDAGLTKLSEALSNLEHLTLICLYFWDREDSELLSQGNISDAGLTKLSAALSNLKRLAHLVIRFSNNHKVSEEGFTKLSKMLSDKEKSPSILQNERNFWEWQL